MRSEESWCKWQSDKITKKSTCKDKINIPLVIKDKIYPIVKDLSANKLLEKWLHGQTQNANEALNGMIWHDCPKTQFVCHQTLEMCVASAVLSYNDGAGGVLNVLKKLKVDPGSFCTQSVRKTD